MTRPRILIVDDDPHICWSLAERLRAERYHVVDARTGDQAIQQIDEGVDLVLLDDNLPHTDSLMMLQHIKEVDPDIVVITVTPKTRLDVDDVALVVARALEMATLRREVRRLHAAQAQPYAVDRIVGESTAMAMLRTLLAKVARSPASTVLLTGESGTGKDLAANVLHYNSDRAHRPFMTVNCCALTETLLESELFGHNRGAVPGARQQRRGLLESADGGTVFLDEIGELTLALQAKLLPVLEYQQFKRVGGSQDIHVDVRVIAATSRNLDEAVMSGTFRQDLFYRLNVLPIALPPLRQHLDDVPALAAFYIGEFNREFRKQVKGMAPAALKLLQNYGWPGNIRELRNAVERAMLLAAREWLEPADFPLVTNPVSTAAFQLPPGGVDLESVEQSLVIQALERSGRNQTKAAQLLGMNRDQIRYRIEKFHLARPVA